MPTVRIRLALPTLAGSLLLSACAGTPHQPAVATPSATPAAASIGIPACDDYLASYQACHRAAGIYPSDQLESRYQAMRDSLQQQAADPSVRPELDQRCRKLADEQRAALNGKPCNGS